MGSGLLLAHLFLSVIPAEAGIQKSWIPVFTGMTELAALGKHPPGYFQVKAGTQPLPDSGPCLRRGELVNCRMAWIRIPTLLLRIGMIRPGRDARPGPTSQLRCTREILPNTASVFIFLAKIGQDQCNPWSSAVLSNSETFEG